MGNRLFTVTSVTAAALAGLHVLGYFFPGSLNWGYHFLGFLPPYGIIVYLFLLACTAALFLRADIDSLCAVPGGWMELRPGLFLASSAVLFVAVSALLRVHASLLGDSFTLILNYRDFQSGVSGLAPWHEPLSIYFLYYAVTLFSSLDAPAVFNAFFVVDTLLGVCFLVTVFFIVRELFEAPAHRFLAFAMLLSLPYVEFFFGYIEIYSVSTLLLALFVLASLRVLRGKMPFTFIPALWLVITLSHYINGVLAVPVLYLTYLAYREGGMRRIAAGYGIAGALALAVLAAAGFRPDRLINLSPVSHFLSVTGDLSPFNAYSQAYTLFSPYHLMDLGTTLVMMAPFATVLLAAFAWRYRGGIFVKTPVSVWFACALLPLSLVWAVSKLEQGSASDWDVFAGQFLLFHLFILFVLDRFEGRFATKALALIVCVTCLNSATWFAVNSRADPSIRRFVALWDTRNLSHLGNYTMALRLTRYYESQKDTLGQIDTWKRFSGIYPDDPRGYRNAIDAMNTYAPDDFTMRETTYVRWMEADPGNGKLKKEYADGCLLAGIERFSEREYRAARDYFRKAIVCEPASSAAWTNLGTVFAEEGLVDSAMAAYRAAIRFDSTNATACYNLGTLYNGRGDTEAGMRLIQAAAGLGSREAMEFLEKRRAGR